MGVQIPVKNGHMNLSSYQMDRFLEFHDDFSEYENEQKLCVSYIDVILILAI